MNKAVQDYIDRMLEEFGEDWVYYLPVYYYEQRELIEKWGYNVSVLSDEQIDEMFRELIMNELDGIRFKKVNLDGICSTCSVMEWILIHGCPQLERAHFEFPDDKIMNGLFRGCPRMITVSSIPKSEVFVSEPVEKWHEPIRGIRRIMAMDGMWYAEISGRYYYMTT